MFLAGVVVSIFLHLDLSPNVFFLYCFALINIFYLAFFTCTKLCTWEDLCVYLFGYRNKLEHESLTSVYRIRDTKIRDSTASNL